MLMVYAATSQTQSKKQKAYPQGPSVQKPELTDLKQALQLETGMTLHV